MKLPKLRDIRGELQASSTIAHAYNLKFTLLSRDGRMGFMNITPATSGKVHWPMPPRRPVLCVMVERYDDDCAMDHCLLTAAQWQKLRKAGNMLTFGRAVLQGSYLPTALERIDITSKTGGEGEGLELLYELRNRCTVH